MDYKAKRSDCIESIAFERGLFWKTIWNHPKNQGLHESRDRNILFPGDPVFIPEITPKRVGGETEQRHRFRRKGVPAIFKVRILDDDEPRAHEPYELEIDGCWSSGTTDSDGNVEQGISPDAKTARLFVGETRDEYQITLGEIDPVEEIRGIQERLNNLGFECGEFDGTLNARTRTAVILFKRRYGLDETGDLDSVFRGKLVEVHGC